MNLLNLTVLAATVSAYGADAITGRVLNASSAALTDARVWLKSRPDVADSTGADGRFSLTLNPTALTPFSGGVSGLPTFRFNAEGLVVSLQRQQNICLELRNAQGRMAATLFKGRLEKGENSIPLGREVLKLLSGAYYLAFTGEQTAGSLPIRGSFRMAKSAAEGDTLIVLRMGHEIRKLPLADLSARDVGDVSLKLRTYRKDTAVAVKALRRIEVFVPSDYRELYLLPVLYLIHGAGDNEVYWREKGHLLDSLNTFSDREKVQPMIIVTPSAGGAPGVGAYGKTGDPFVPDLAVDIRKYVESHYKADTSRWARGISGLSAGAAQTWMLTLFYPELWGWSRPMSGGLGRSTGYTPEKLKADVASKVVDVAVLNQMKLFKEYSNPSDLALMDTQTTIKIIESLGIKIATDYTTRTSGGHAPVFWNEVFRKYAPLLFKE
ncbi:MAG: alpha/beta hydrolase-fold protein [Fibrobacteria bacterium]